MAARRIPTILPPLTLEESIEVSKIYSICGLLKPDTPLVLQRPFRSPHHSTTAQAMAGGGRNPKPGEISLASYGTLFLDELTEFQPKILDLLRQPMEEGSITVSRLNQTVVFPAKTMIAAAMNPCKCGFFPDLGKMPLYSNPDPPVSEPRFGTIFRSDRYWGGSTAAGFGYDGFREEYR